jgi:molybdopterin-binding protein
MNDLPANIAAVESYGHLSLVKAVIEEDVFTAIVIDTPQTAPYLTAGSTVHLLFKENEVAVAKSFSGEISLQNRFSCTIRAIESGRLLTRLLLQYRQFDLSAVITTNAARQMNLAKGDNVVAFVKTNEITLSPL